jgi:hypothetical protein
MMSTSRVLHLAKHFLQRCTLTKCPLGQSNHSQLSIENSTLHQTNWRALPVWRH